MVGIWVGGGCGEGGFLGCWVKDGWDGGVVVEF